MARGLGIIKEALIAIGEALSYLPTLLFVFFPFMVGGFALFVSISEDRKHAELEAWKELERIYKGDLADFFEKNTSKEYEPELELEISALESSLPQICLSCKEAPSDKLEECFIRKLYKTLRNEKEYKILRQEWEKLDDRVIMEQEIARECADTLRFHGLYSLW
jgi:hypothetical protein